MHRFQSNENSSPVRQLWRKRILITRPRHQAEQICKWIEDAGGHAIQLALLNIADLKDISRVIQLLRHFDRFDMAIFVSANAVHKTDDLMNTLGIGFPSHMKVAAIGRQTAKTLRDLGHRVDLTPQHGFNSEAFLAMRQTQEVKDLHIVIFRGVGGRELIRRGLLERGANVEYAEVYRRLKPSIADTGVRRKLCESNINLITITSSEAIRNLHSLIAESGQNSLLDICLLAGSRRIAETARSLGFTRIRAAPDPSDSSVFTEILKWAQESERNS